MAPLLTHLAVYLVRGSPPLSKCFVKCHFDILLYHCVKLVEVLQLLITALRFRYCCNINRQHIRLLFPVLEILPHLLLNGFLGSLLRSHNVRHLVFAKNILKFNTGLTSSNRMFLSPYKHLTTSLSI